MDLNLPDLAGSAGPEPTNLRAALQDRDLASLQRGYVLLRDALEGVTRELSSLRGQDDPTVRAARRALTQAALR